MSVETQLRDYATRIEATPISIEEITSPRRVVAPTTWHRPVLAAAAALLVVAGIGAVVVQSRGSVSTRPGANTTTTEATTPGSSTTATSTAVAAVEPITKRWLPTYLPDGWKVSDETESGEELSPSVSIRRGDAIMLIEAAAPGTTSGTPPGGPLLFAEIVEINGSPVTLTSFGDGYVGLSTYGPAGFEATTRGFAEQEVIEAAKSLRIDWPNGTITATAPPGATLTTYGHATDSGVSVNLVDRSGAYAGTVSIVRTGAMTRYDDSFRALDLPAPRAIGGGYLAVARLQRRDNAEADRIIDSLVEVDPSTIPTSSGSGDVSPSTTVLTKLAAIGFGSSMFEAVGTPDHPCLSFSRESTNWCEFGPQALHDIRVGPGDGATLILAGIVKGDVNNVAIEFSDGTIATNASTVPNFAPGRSLFAAEIPAGLNIRAVTTYDAAGEQIERIGRPPK
jgi:hypothetical protein